MTNKKAIKQMMEVVVPSDTARRCSNCGQMALSKKMREYLSDRCPYCGAHMEWESQYE